ncbi:DUF6771 family protein [Sphingomonas nostoxanthinifaciens]|uniref:DUF6771 family protein n=1 Tax=Sphingomonas nostoxanthinifaciens TaxID=2872652 RepID=UPI0037D99DE4
MSRIDPVSALLNAPTWALLGLAVKDARLRERSANTVAATMLAKLDGDDRPDPCQLGFVL